MCISAVTWGIPADDVEAARDLLRSERAGTQQALQAGEPARPLIRRLLELGLWDEAESAMRTHSGLGALDKALLKIRFSWLNNDFKAAEDQVQRVLQTHPDQSEALQFRATLYIESWELQKAVDLCEHLLKKDPENLQIQLILGRALLLQKRYPEALELAKSLQKAHPDLGKAYLLEADVYFWDQQPAKAEAPLKRALELDPFDADARFSYGYAIWRRVDATQLDAMAAQWELALMLNPLHFSTHWHWGNGHTNLTFADYADPDEKAIRKALAPADSLFSRGDLSDARKLIHRVGKKYPGSVLPLMHEASLLYSDFESAERAAELERAQELFLQILEKKPHYGPAHNGLAAVIKSKRIPYLSFYDSLTRVLEHVEISDPEYFKEVFPDMSYYPGDRVQAMVWNQLYTSVVYFPFLSKQGNQFVIPPLHIDLAIAMHRPAFRYTTTFDNRQWMDIRGVGSGAADIGYTERGAYFERNVVLHEYVHLFHGRVLTDQENREIRALYYNAMEHDQTLDYYSQNNESEYFAQTYPAYFEPMKVHPLDFKSMNTRKDLMTRDPEMYAFLDKLVKKERAYLNGNHEVMASNWAQVYLNLSRRHRDNPEKAARLLDTALQYDAAYLPAYLAYAELKQRSEDFQAAEALLDKAKNINADYAPVYAAYAELLGARYMQDHSLDIKSRQVELLQKAISLESDYQTAAGIHRQLRTLLLDYGDLQGAIAAAEAYGKDGPEVSTYLRDRKHDAQAFAAAYRAIQGDSTGIPRLQYLIGQKPQNYGLRALYSDALQALGKHRASIANLEAAQRILGSVGDARADFDLRIAESRYVLGELQPEALDAVLQQAGELEPMLGLRLVNLLAKTGRKKDAQDVFKELPGDGMPYYMQHYRQSGTLLKQ